MIEVIHEYLKNTITPKKHYTAQITLHNDTKYPKYTPTIIIDIQAILDCKEHIQIPIETITCTIIQDILQIRYMHQQTQPIKIELANPNLLEQLTNTIENELKNASIEDSKLYHHT